MRKRLLAAATAAALGAAAPASAAELTVTTSGRTFNPARALVVSGDTVRWRNTDQVAHNVTGSELRSGNLAPGAVFSQRFDQPGTHAYVCTLHPFMKGQVDVVGGLLEGPSGDVIKGSTVELSGRFPAGTGTVTLERLAEGNGEAVANATPAADGSFRASVTAHDTASYRAVAAGVATAPVVIRVVSELRVRLSVQRGRRFDRVRVRVRPAPQGDYTAVLQLYSRERFSWRRAGHRELDNDGRTTFRVRHGLRRRARVLLLSADRSEVAASSSIRLWRHGGVRPSKPTRPGGADHGGSGGHGGGHAGH